MAKNLKIKIKNTQLAKAAGLNKLKDKLAAKKKKEKEPEDEKISKENEAVKEPVQEDQKPRRIRARSKSAFAQEEEFPVEEQKALSAEEIEDKSEKSELAQESVPASEPQPSESIQEEKTPSPSEEEKLGPTGRHIKDLLPAKKEKPRVEPKKEEQAAPKPPPGGEEAEAENQQAKDKKKGKKVKEFKDLKPLKKEVRTFDARDRQGLTAGEDERWRKRRASKGQRLRSEDAMPVTRPTSLRIRLPISIKDLAAEMKLKASELIQKLFLQGMPLTLNDSLDDETIVQFLGSEFGCEIAIDTTEEDRIQITSQSIQEEIAASSSEVLKLRPPVVTFMGHVDHGKTSLIDVIRTSNIAAGEAGAITQHMGAFKCKTPVGELTILDTPGHEAFSAMRARGALVTDIVVLVVAGDEGIKEQTIEAIQHAQAAEVSIVVAINKCDKPNFNAENVYRELSEHNLVPESWGGQIITVNTSAVSKEGIPQLLEMLALQAEVLELKANPSARARGRVLESELHKGLGNVATVLVQNGTLRQGDALVFDRLWGRVKTMHDEHGNLLKEAPPSTPVEITGISGLPAAGDPFIVVKDEREAREIAEARAVGTRQKALLQRKPPTLESLLQKEGAAGKKVLKLIIRADVQGSIEALRSALLKIESEKAEIDIIFTGVGEISESDVQLAAASNAVILGFHTKLESHAESLVKELGVAIRLFDVIYHAVDEIREILSGLLEKIVEEEDRGVAEVKATFKASQLGVIAGCLVTEGTIHRNHRVRVVRDGEVIWRGGIASLKRVKEDVREVKKGLECGILLDGFNDVQVDDQLQAYEIVYKKQQL